jgi:hypothetical protein
MKTLRNLWLMLCVVCFTAVMRADPPAYTGTVFDGLQEVIDDAGLFFGVVIALAVIVTGFFLGRRWLAKVG